MRRGMTPEEARLAAERGFDGVEQTKELHRDARSFACLDTARRDLRLAVRTLRRAPGFTATIVLTLAVGIGANTAMFSVISGVILRPLGYPDAARIVAVQTRWTDTGRTQANLAGGDEIDISARHETFEAVAYHQGGDMGVRVGDQAEMVGGAARASGLLPRVRRGPGGGTTVQPRRRPAVGDREPRIRAAPLRQRDDGGRASPCSSGARRTRSSA